MTALDIVLNEPHEQIVFDGTRFRVVKAGRGFGKTQLVLAAMFEHLQTEYRDAAGQVLPHKIYYAAETRIQAKNIFWDRLNDFFRPIIASVNISELRITLINGAQIQLHGSNRVDSLRGAYLTLFIADEFAFHTRGDYWVRIVRPMLDRVRPYGGALFVSTPKAFGEFYRLQQKGLEGAKGYKTWVYTSLDGGFIDQQAIDDAKADFTYQDWRREYFAEDVAPSDAVYYQFNRELHCPKNGPPYIHGQDIHWAWDFNVKPAVHSVLSHQHLGKTYFFDELCIGNTPDNVDAFCEKYPKEGLGRVYLYGDYNGTYGTNGITDFQAIQCVLQQRGYDLPELRVYGGNPIVRRRTENVNRLLMDANKDIRIFVNKKTCPKLVRDFEQVKWAEKSADIDKTTDPTVTHCSDSIGYQLWVTDPPEWAKPKNKPYSQRPKVVEPSGWWHD